MLCPPPVTAQTCTWEGTSAVNPPAAKFLRSERNPLGLPGRIATGASGLVYMTDPQAGTVVITDSHGRPVSLKEDLARRFAIAVAADGKIYVGETEKGSVTVFDEGWNRVGHLNNDNHGLGTGSASLKPGHGWEDDDIVPCTACHVPKHGSTNLFQLRTTIYSKDGSTPIPSDCGGTTVELTDNSIEDTAVNGWCFCNTCHEGSMGDNRDSCFRSGCHTHSDDL